MYEDMKPPMVASASCIGTRQSHIPTELAELFEASQQAAKVFYDVRDRLRPVLREDCDVEKTCTNVEPPSTMTPFTEELRKTRWEVEALTNQMRDVLRRIEL